MTPTTRRTHRSLAGLTALVLAVAALLGSAGGSAAAVPPDYSNVGIGLTSFMSGLSGPVQVTNAGDGSKRLFVVEQRGVIKVWRSGHGLSTFLDMRSRVAFGGERGLLALAFHPSFERNRKFYVLFTEKGTGDVIVAEFKASASNRNRAVPSSFRRLLRIGHRAHANHNGGMLAFGTRNGFLYISVGDGGGAGDTANNAQSRKTRLGKILRIDVNGTSSGLAYRIPRNNPYAHSLIYKREIWSRGLRNPWRFSFDRLTGDLWIGDVGQGAWEEIDHATLSGTGGRDANYGWHVMEGNACYQTGCDTAGFTMPVAVYDHSQGCAVIGGYVYRGPQAILRGAYLFSDVCSGKIWSIVAAGPSPQTPTLMADTGLGITSFGEGESGTVYITAQNGHVYRLSAFSR
jgi:glucose/arabinose dehydrogenase